MNPYSLLLRAGQLCLVCAFFGASTYCGYVAFAHTQQGEPVIENGVFVDKHEIDFGEVKQHQELRHRFVITNRTSEIIRFGDVGTSCGCTASELSTRELAPGSAASLDVRWDTRGYRRPGMQLIEVNYRAGVSDPLILSMTLRADVKPAVLASVEQLEFDQNKAGTQSISLQRRDGGDLTITGVRSSQDSIQVAIKGSAFDVSFDPKLYRVEGGQPLVTVWTNCEDEKILQFYVRIRQ